MIDAEKLKHVAESLQAVVAERKEACNEEQKALAALKKATTRREATDVKYRSAMEEYWRIGHGFDSAEEMRKEHEAEKVDRLAFEADRRHAEAIACSTPTN